jgi:IS1 family transposase
MSNVTYALPFHLLRDVLCLRIAVIQDFVTLHATRMVSTSYVERQNLTMRMGMRRFMRLTNAFSKKLENLRHAVAIHYMHYKNW